MGVPTQQTETKKQEGWEWSLCECGVCISTKTRSACSIAMEGQTLRVNQRRATNNNSARAKMRRVFFRGFRHIQPGLTMAGRSKSIFFPFRLGT